jgi:hypothetical protein
MSLRIRTLLILSLSIALGTGIAGYVVTSWLVEGFRALEESDALRDMERCAIWSAIARPSSNLLMT